jgi:uncharacterized protein YbjT (DUF2867 family)
MTNRNGIVLVTGATGRQGGSVVRHMLAQGWKLGALSRDPSSAAARSLIDRGVEVLCGDLEDPGSLGKAVHGAFGVYSVQDFWPSARSVKCSRERT